MPRIFAEGAGFVATSATAQAERAGRRTASAM
jgi:hypothetical protein